jgi:hypothetical protein
MPSLLEAAQHHDRALAAWELYQRAVQAQDSRHFDIGGALAVAQDAATPSLLPQFGFRRTLEMTPSAQLERQKKLPRQYEAWTVDPSARAVVSRLRNAVAQAIVREPCVDGTVVETVRLDALERAWQASCQTAALPDSMLESDARETQLAAALAARTIGLPWTADADGERLTRTLPAHPLRLPTSREPLWAVYGKGDRETRVECVAWAVLPAGDTYTDSPQDEILMASYCGWQKLCKGIWAALMDRKRSLVSLPYLAEQYGRTSVVYRSARRLEGKRRYQTFWNERPLGRSGKAHVVIEAMEVCRPAIGVPFAHIVGSDATPDFARFARQLAAALRLPVRPEWSHDLWRLASTEDKARGRPALIWRIPSFGCAAFWVRADLDAAWAQIIATLAGARGPQAGAIERTGELTVTSTTVVATPLGDDEDDLPLAA